MQKHFTHAAPRSGQFTHAAVRWLHKVHSLTGSLPLRLPLCSTERVQIGGSLIGGIRETQEMLDFCAQHGVAAITETIPIDQVNEAYTRMIKSDVKYRWVTGWRR